MAVYLIDFENVHSGGISGVENLSADDKVYIFYTENASSLSFSSHIKLLACPAEVTYYNVDAGGKNALDFQLASFLGYLIGSGGDDCYYIISGDRGYDNVKKFWEKSGLRKEISIIGAKSVKSAVKPAEQILTIKIDQDEKKTISEQPAVKQSAPASPVVPEQEAKTEAKAETKPEAKPEVKTEAPVKPKADKPSGKKVSVPKYIKNILSKAGVQAEYDEIGAIVELVKTSGGKQQFYRDCMKNLGRDKGREVYTLLKDEFDKLAEMLII
ncbi:MAG: PIN domain-containing protein [Oscillospiraceae bacterium]